MSDRSKLYVPAMLGIFGAHLTTSAVPLQYSTIRITSALVAHAIPVSNMARRPHTGSLKSIPIDSMLSRHSIVAMISVLMKGLPITLLYMDILDMDTI